MLERRRQATCKALRTGGWIALVLILPSVSLGERNVVVSGAVYRDANANGRRDPGEKGLPGVMVSDGEAIRHTGSAGRYAFDFSVAENRFVFVVRPSGQRLSTPFAHRIGPDETAQSYTVDFGMVEDASARDRDFTFLVTADSQFTSKSQADLLREEFAQITAMACDPAFFFSVGDLTMNGTNEEFDLYRYALEPFTIDAYHVFGGHDGNYARRDGNPGSVAHYEEKLNAPPYYAWQYGGVHFVNYVREYHYLSAEGLRRQAAWLDAYFEAIPEKSEVVTIAHYPAEPAQFDRWAAHHHIIAHFYGHWHGNGIARYRSIPLVRSGPARGLDWGAFTRTIRVCRFQDGNLSTELRPTGQYRRLDIVSPGSGERVMRRRIPIQVLAFDMAAWVDRVPCTIRSGSANQAVALERQGQWTWSGTWDATGAKPGDYTIVATSHDNRAASWSAEHVFTLGAGDAPEVRPGGDWPGLTMRAGRRMEKPLEPPLALAWVAHTGGRNMLASSPVVMGGRVFVAVQDDDLGAAAAGVACFDVRTGRRLWKTRTDTSIANSPTALADHVYALSTAGIAYALAADTGKVVWQRDIYPDTATHRYCGGPVAVADGMVLVSGEGGPLVMLDAATDREVRRVKTSNDTYMSGPTVVDGVVYTTGQNDVTATDLPTGNRRWRTKVSRLRGVSTPVVENGVVYSNGQRSRAFDAASGKPLWEQATENGSRATAVPVVDGDLVYCGGRIVTALNRKTGEPVWRFTVGQDEARFKNNRRQTLGGGSSPVVSGNILYFGSDDGYLYGLDKKTGELKWRYWLAVPVKSALAASGNALFVTDYDGNLYAFVGWSG